MKALWQGKPMVLIPWGRDQPGVAARARSLGVAEVVPCEQATAETIAAAVTRSLASQDMARTAARHSARLRATNPPANAAAHLESLLE
jgi:UDP:flavonoid glycosyltransferase YjiC (YdhE family)